MNRKDFAAAIQPFLGRELTQQEEEYAEAIAYEAMDSGAVTPAQCDKMLARCPNFCRCPSVGTVWEFEKEKKEWEERTGSPFPGGCC